MCRELAGHPNLSLFLGNYADALGALGHFDRAKTAFLEAADLLRDGLTPRDAAQHLLWVADATWGWGHGAVAAARPLYEEALSRFQQLGDEHFVATVLAHLSHIAFDARQHARAARYIAEALTLDRTVVDHRQIICLDLENGAEVATRRLPETSKRWYVVRDEPNTIEPRIIDTGGTNVVFVRSYPESLAPGEGETILGLDMPELRIWWQQGVPASACQYAVAADAVALLRWGTGCGDPVVTTFRDERPHAQIGFGPPPRFGSEPCDGLGCLTPIEFVASRSGLDVALVLLWGPSSRHYHAELVEIGVYDAMSWRLPLADGTDEEVDRANDVLVGANDRHWIVSDGNQPRVLSSA
ncbi:MAG: hypothetical protein ACRDJH_00215, partial [Thermomicrobiales bacterium]